MLPYSWQYQVKKPTGDARCFVEFDWYYPVELAGKKLHFYINGSVASGEDLNDRELSGSPMSATAKPDLYISDPIFIPSGADQGYNRLVVSNTTGAELKIKKVTELDSKSGNLDTDITSQCKTSKDGLSLLIPAVSYARRVRVEAQVPYSEQIYYDLEPKVVQMAAFHNPKEFNLQASWADNGGTLLQWTVPYADQEDVLPADLIMVERQLYNSNDGTADIWQTLDHLVLEKGKSAYSYTDSQSGCYGTDKFNSVRYRIYRAAVGATEKYCSVAEMNDKSSQVSPGSLSITKASLADGSVTIEAQVELGSQPQTRAFLPKNWKVVLRRTATYWKNGIATSTYKDIDMSKHITVDEASLKRMRFVDEAFAPCTQYAYTLIFNPNDPAGVMKIQETAVAIEQGGQSQTIIEPVADDSKVGSFTASDNTLQDRIHLQWSLDTERMNKIKVEKYAGSWVELPIDAKMNYFDDFGVEAGRSVQYRLTMEYECTDGIKTLTVSATGQRRPSGKIGGFVTFQDGTGLANVEVQLLQAETIVESTTTDANGRSLLYLTIFAEEPGIKLHFRMWDASSGIIYALTPDQTVSYTHDAIIGTYDKPVILTTGLNITRELALVPTWNWVSLNVASSLANNVGTLLQHGHWTKGDQLKDLEERTFFSYDAGKWYYNGDTEYDTLRTDRMYCIKSQHAQTIHIDGRPLMDEKERTITLHNGWNYIGYTPLVNLPLNEALTDFFAKASEGDVIKSQHEFATFNAKSGGWHGNLEYMKPGEGYMLYHQVTEQRPDKTTTFVYPFKSTSGITGTKSVANRQNSAPLFKNHCSTTMTMIAKADGVDVQEGDRLLAYADGELCGVAEATSSSVFYISIGGEKQRQLMFTLERNGQLLATATRDAVVYKKNSHEGTTDVPRILNFNGTDLFEDGIYYTLTGMRYGSKHPTVKGIYIYNNKKVIIK